MSTTQAAFQTAQGESKQLSAKPSNDELLDLYALFKIGEGEDFDAAEKPGMFDLKGKAKRTAWEKHVDKGTTQEEAQKQYVELVESLKTKYGFGADKTPETVGTS